MQTTVTEWGEICNIAEISGYFIVYLFLKDPTAMRQAKSTIILIIIIFTSHIKGFAFGFSALSTSDGLSQSDVTAIIQDSVGFMWFATNNGLTRYDGNRFRIYKADSRNERSVSGNTIFTLANDGSSIWIGSREGVDHYDMLLDKFTPYNNCLLYTSPSPRD